MSCPNCGHTMHGLGENAGTRHFWCPRCGTVLTKTGDFSDPTLPRWTRLMIEFKHQEIYKEMRAAAASMAQVAGDAAAVADRRAAAAPQIQADPQECEGFGRGGKGKCCERSGEYNGVDSGPRLFTCPKHCGCHH